MRSSRSWAFRKLEFICNPSALRNSLRQFLAPGNGLRMGFYLDMDVTGGNGERPRRMKEAKIPMKNLCKLGHGVQVG